MMEQTEVYLQLERGGKSKLTAVSPAFQPPTKDTQYGPILDSKVLTQEMQIKPKAHQQTGKDTAVSKCTCPHSLC